ncbi:MAG TPA: YceI family protein [Ktedonobacterales bacterium]|nr:YceI family protein [Ktedonobacterales bacterium]
MYTYIIDADQTTLSFSVRRLIRSRGTFTRIAGTVTVNEDGTPNSLEVIIAARSLDTSMPPRDMHLRTASFLAVGRYPMITYNSQDIAQVGPERYTIRGLLRFHGREQPVMLEAVLEPDDGTDGIRRVQVSGVLSRAAFAIPPNPVLDVLMRGMIGDEVHVTSRVCLTPMRDGVVQEPISLPSSQPQQ